MSIPARSSVVLGVVASSLLVSACITGERPTLVPDTPVDDPAAAAVAQRLARADTLAFTATYEITPSIVGASTTTATVVQADGMRTVTIGEVEYVADATGATTCGGGECVEFLDDARVSDLNITHRFFGPAFLDRLEADAGRRVGFTEGSTTTIAGQPATCVRVALAGGSVDYCALDAGVLARYVGADVSIELTSFSFAAPTDQIDT